MIIELGYDPVADYEDRVDGDGGSFVITSRDTIVYRDTRSVTEPSIVCSCDAYKASTLYTIVPSDSDQTTGKADASANDLDDVLYEFSGVPRIVATRDSAGTTINVSAVGSSVHPNFRLYRASDHRSTFSVTSNTTTLPYTDSGLDASLNYKYKATYVATGTKDGSPYVEQSQSSRPAYTVGNKRI